MKKKMRIDTIFLSRIKIPISIFFFGGVLLFGIPQGVYADPPVCPYNTVISRATTDLECGTFCRDTGFARSEWSDAGWKDYPSAKCCCKDRRTSAAPAPVIGGPQAFENPLVAGEDVPKIIGSILRSFLGILGVIALVIFIYGGLLWMTSMGDEQKVNRGRETLIWSGLGIIVILGSYIAVQFILNAVLSPPRPTTGTPATTTIATGTSGTATSSGGASFSSGGGSSGSPGGTSLPSSSPSTSSPSETPSVTPPEASTSPTAEEESTSGGDEGGVQRPQRLTITF